MALTVKHARPTAQQEAIGKLIVTMTRARGGDLESCAGAVAVSIQESGLNPTIRGPTTPGGRTHIGLYQQDPSWGTEAQRMNPRYAITKFLDQYLSYRKQGKGWQDAGERTQRSGAGSAPAQWYSEGVAFARAFTGAGGPGDLNLDVGGAGAQPGFGGNGGGETRVLPYEFTRGSADKRDENSWDAIGRLADEVKWRRFMRRGELWYVSNNWLFDRGPVFRFSEGARGVMSISFDFETRSEATQATVTVQSERYTILPGDVVEIEGEGPADGLWVTSGLRRSLFSSQQEVTLVRKEAALDEPAPQTQTVTVGEGSGPGFPGGMGSVQFNTNLAGGGDLASRVYRAAQEATRQGWRYSQDRRNSQGPGGYADCSSGVSWVLAKAGIRLPGPLRPNAPTSGMFMNWEQPGFGRRITVCAHGGHVWMMFHNFPMKRFDTGGGSGGRLWPTQNGPGYIAGFVKRHPRGC